jgi:hypothetical protein
MGYTRVEPQPVEVIFNGAPVDPSGGGGGTSDGALEVTQLAIKAAVESTGYPEPLAAGGVFAVKVDQTGAGTATPGAADIDERYSVCGWRLSFTAGGTLTIKTHDSDAEQSIVFDVPSSGIDEAKVGDWAWFTGSAVNKPVTFANSAGNMKGVVYLRKHI